MAENIQDFSYPDDPDSGGYEQSTLLASEQLHDPLSEEEDEDHAREVSSWKRLPWWKRPSPYWLILTIPIGSIAFSAVLAPKVAMYTSLVCRVHRPEYFADNHSLFLPFTRNIAADVPILSGSNGSVTSTLLSNSTYTTLSDYTQTGLDVEQRCSSDPLVQALVARLTAVSSTTMGVLSCLTTGWWGSLSDRYGRRIVIFVSIFGLFATDLIHVVTAWFGNVLPGGYWFLLVGFLIEGLCGSVSAGVAANHAYLADTTDPSTMSRYLSLSLGFMFTGVAIGPVLGGLLIRSTGTTLSVFYFTAILHALYSIFIYFVLPESLTRARARGAHQRRKHQASTLGFVGSFVRFLSPLVVLLPEKPVDANPLKQTRSDRSLFFIAIAYGAVTTIYGSFSYKFQYAAAQFHWTPEMTSYYVSFIGATRAVFLAGVLPVIIKYLKAKYFRLSPTHDVPLQDINSSSSPCHGASTPPGAGQNKASEQHVSVSRFPALDLALARISAGMDTLAYLAMAIASTGALFAVASTTGSFSAGFSPATQALALHIYTSRRSENRGEVGKLFGALSVIHTLGAHILGPALYGFIYFNTVTSFPQAIMVVSMCTTTLSFIFLLLVRIPYKPTDSCVGHGNGEEFQDPPTPETLIGLENGVVEGDIDKEAAAGMGH